MITRQMHREENRRIPSDERGFTIGEMMVTTILVLIVGSIVVLGVSFSTRQYNRSMMQSESKLLCTTLSNAIQSELANTDRVKLGSKVSGHVYNVNSFFSPTYAIPQNEKMTGFYSVSVDEAHNFTIAPGGYGELLLGADVGGKLYGHLILGSSSYTSYDLGARVDEFTYDEGSNTFHFRVSVGKDGKELTHRAVDVVPLNKLTIN